MFDTAYQTLTMRVYLSAAVAPLQRAVFAVGASTAPAISTRQRDAGGKSGVPLSALRVVCRYPGNGSSKFCAIKGGLVEHLNGLLRRVSGARWAPAADIDPSIYRMALHEGITPEQLNQLLE